MLWKPVKRLSDFSIAECNGYVQRLLCKGLQKLLNSESGEMRRSKAWLRCDHGCWKWYVLPPNMLVVKSMASLLGIHSRGKACITSNHQPSNHAECCHYADAKILRAYCSFLNCGEIVETIIQDFQLEGKWAIPYLWNSIHPWFQRASNNELWIKLSALAPN